MTRDRMDYDIVIVGAGPAGLAAAIRLKQASPRLLVCVLEKGGEVGAHILSGAVIDPVALDELLPDWRSMGCPLDQPVTESQHWWLGSRRAWTFPHQLLPPLMSNVGCYTGSLGALCRWLAEQAETLGVEIFAGFAAAELLFDEGGAVVGVAIGEMGVARDGRRKPDWQPGVAIHARYTLLAEGACGSLTKQAKRLFGLDRGAQPQVYALGLKELWEIDPAHHVPGRVIHTQGWPLSRDGFGGGFIYHQPNCQLAVGFVVGLGYRNPHLSPYLEFQRWKQHAAIRPLLEGGRRLSYGARVINEGGWQAVPDLVFPGGALIGCSAGFVNVPRIKGVHSAMKSGMLAADAAAAALPANRGGDRLDAYSDAVAKSWITRELRAVRNAEPALARFGPIAGTLFAGADLWLSAFGITLPWTFGHRPDHGQLTDRREASPVAYPHSDGAISFDRSASVYLSNTAHEEDQPVHLALADAEVPIAINLDRYDAPEQHYCPAGVYEIADAGPGAPRLQINASNCLHCKACDIKDPTQNIHWTVPEGSGGPNYVNM